MSWSAPADNGGGAITGYRVYVDGNAIGDVGGSSTGATVNNVPTGTHEFGVAAINSATGRSRDGTVNVSHRPDEAKAGQAADREGDGGQARRREDREDRLAAACGRGQPRDQRLPDHRLPAEQPRQVREDQHLAGARVGRALHHLRVELVGEAEVRGQGTQRSRLRSVERQVQRGPTAVVRASRAPAATRAASARVVVPVLPIAEDR